jgi:lysophospholipase L1-like esterase
MKFISRKEHNILAGLLLAAVAASPVRASVLVLYNFNSITTPLAASTVGSGISSASNIGFGGYADAWIESTGVLQLNPAAANNAVSAVASGNYATFTLTSIMPMNLSSLTLDAGYGQFSSPAGYVVESSVDGYSSILSTATFTTQAPTFATYTIDLSGASFQGLSNITFRVAGYVANVGDEQFDNITVNGSLGVPVSAANTTISANPSSITADGTSTSTLTVQARDADNDNLTSSSGTITLSTTAGWLSGVTDNGDGTYTATLTSTTTPGTANITGTIGGIAIGHTASVTLTPRAGTLLFTKIEFVPTGTHVVWDAVPGQSYSVLASSNLVTTLVNWSPISVGAAGDFIDTGSRAGVPQMFYRVKENINPNPRISINKPTAGYTADAFQNSSGVNDGIFNTYATTWNAGFPTPAAPAWIAINLGQGPTRVLLEWNAGGNYNYQETDYGGPGNYAIYTSSNSTTGADGTWSQVVSVTNNIYRTRSHSFDFTGMKWVKMVISAAPANSLNGAAFDEIEVYDISTAYSRGRIAEDTWFFMGDSITAFWADRNTASGTNDPASHQPSFAAWIQIDNTNYFPSMINGGIGGETSANGLARLAQNLADNPDYHYWALDYGANDAAGNNSNTANFRANMQAMITMLLANGRMPVIPHLSYATDGGHNYATNFNAVIDALVVSNGILAGPDCYTFFKANTNQLSDGLHPNDAGMRSYNLLWSQAMRHLYP